MIGWLLLGGGMALLALGRGRGRGRGTEYRSLREFVTSVDRGEWDTSGLDPETAAFFGPDREWFLERVEGWEVDAPEWVELAEHSTGGPPAPILIPIAMYEGRPAHLRAWAAIAAEGGYDRAAHSLENKAYLAERT